MATYVWLFPILFIFHDMEEIIGFIPWYQKNKKLLEKRFSKICKVYENVRAIKKYIPALITSVIAVPIGCIVIRNSLNVLNYSTEALLLYSVAGIALVSLNLKFAHWLMKKFTLWMEMTN